MNINQAIANAIRAYPTLYRCRTDVLHQWFCVNGNGMEWHNGKLGDGYYEPVQSLDELIADAIDLAQQRKLFDNPVMLARHRIDIARRTAEVTFNYIHADDLALICWDSPIAMARGADGFPPQRIYPLCEYARMNTVPDDVDSEYLAAVREMIFHVFESNKASVSYTCTQDEKAAEVIKNRQFADHVLQNLAKRFGSGDLPTSYEEWRIARDKKYQWLGEELKKILI